MLSHFASALVFPRPPHPLDRGTRGCNKRFESDETTSTTKYLKTSPPTTRIVSAFPSCHRIFQRSRIYILRCLTCSAVTVVLACLFIHSHPARGRVCLALVVGKGGREGEQSAVVSTPTSGSSIRRPWFLSSCRICLALTCVLGIIWLRTTSLPVIVILHYLHCI